MSILAFDPGQRTGYALITDEGLLVQAGSFGWQEWDTLTSLFVHNPEHVVVERFALYGNKAGAMVGNEFEAAQVIGAIRYVMHRMMISNRLHFQPASAIHSSTRTLSPFAKRLLASVELMRGQVDRHAKDALAHALVYRRKLVA